METFLTIIGVIIFIILISLRQINQYQRGVKFTMGRYQGIMNPGWRIVIPIFQFYKKVDMRVKAVDVPDQKAITRDNVSVMVNAVIYYKVASAEKAIIEVEDFRYAITQFAQTTMRNIVGEATLDELLANRDKIADRIREIVDKETLLQWEKEEGNESLKFHEWMNSARGEKDREWNYTQYMYHEMRSTRYGAYAANACPKIGDKSGWARDVALARGDSAPGRAERWMAFAGILAILADVPTSALEIPGQAAASVITTGAGLPHAMEGAAALGNRRLLERLTKGIGGIWIYVQCTKCECSKVSDREGKTRSALQWTDAGEPKWVPCDLGKTAWGKLHASLIMDATSGGPKYMLFPGLLKAQHVSAWTEVQDECAGQARDACTR